MSPTRCTAYFYGRGVVRLVPGRRCDRPAGHTGQHRTTRSGLGWPFTYYWGKP